MAKPELITKGEPVLITGPRIVMPNLQELVSFGGLSGNPAEIANLLTYETPGPGILRAKAMKLPEQFSGAAIIGAPGTEVDMAGNFTRAGGSRIVVATAEETAALTKGNLTVASPPAKIIG